MEVPENKTAIESNRQAWNDSADHHQNSPDWQALLNEVAQADFSCLDDTLSGLLDVNGKDVIQLGCNNGRESLSLFALGASSVVGVDQSAAFLEQAAYSMLAHRTLPSLSKAISIICLGHCITGLMSP